MTTAVAPLTATLPVIIGAADQALLDRALDDSRAPNTRAQYRSALKAWVAWTVAEGHRPLPAAPEVVAIYLARMAQDGKAASTIRAARAAIGAAHRDAGLANPVHDEDVKRRVKGLERQTTGRGRGQAQGLTADDVAGILAVADRPRRTGRGWESPEAAAERGAVDRAIAGLLFQGALRRSEAAALTWADITDATDGAGIRVTVRTSKTDQTGERPSVRYLKNGSAAAVRMLRDRLTVRASGMRPADDAPVLGGLNGQSIARRLTAAAQAAGISGRITGHSGRVGLASELTTRGASTTETMLAGGWKTARMVAHYSAGAAAEQGAVAKYL